MSLSGLDYVIEKLTDEERRLILRRAYALNEAHAATAKSYLIVAALLVLAAALLLIGVRFL